MNGILHPIGTVKSVFHFKNGTPRQSSLCDSARGIITIEKSIFNNPEHSLMGLEEFSHAWIIFIFHKSNKHTKAKVKPPRLNGQKVGVFSTRSPYRPNNIGLSLVKIDKIEGASVHISGIDILDGTPVIDIKPYIPEYDKPKEELTQVQCEVPSLDSCIATDITQDSFVNYNDIDVYRGATVQNKDSASDVNVGCSSKISDIHFVKTGTVITSDSSQDNSIVIIEGHKCGETVGGCNDCANSQEPENSLTRDPSSFINEEIRTNLDPISEGFYAISSALERAGEKLGRVASQNKSPIGKTRKKQLHSNSSDHNLCNNLLADLIYTEDISENVRVDNLSCKTYFESAYINSGELSHNAYLPEELTACETNLSSMINTTVSNISTEKHKTKCIEASPSNSENSCTDYKMQTFVAPWLLNPPVSKLNVTFTSQAIGQLNNFSKQSHDSRFQLQMFSSPEEAQKSISDILREDPRSVYRRQHFQNNLYYFAVDVLHVTCWFDEDTAQVVRVKPVAFVPNLQQI